MRIYWHPTGPDHAALTVCRTWFDQLSDAERDLVLRHVCASAPVTLEQLALDHNTLRQTMRRCRNRLLDSLNQAFNEDLAAMSAVSAVEKDLQVPTEWRILVTRHPWLAVAVSEHHPLAPLHMLFGLRWRDASHGAWLFDGDLDDCMAATLNALALGAREVMSQHTVQRRLRDAGIPAPEDGAQLHRWLTHCGLVYQPTQHGWTCLSAPETLTESVHPGEWAEVENVTLSPSQHISHALSRMAALFPETYEHPTTVTLGQILASVDQLPHELGQLARRVRDTALDPDGEWTFTPDTLQPLPSTETPSAVVTQPHYAHQRSWWLHRLAGDLRELSLTSHQPGTGDQDGESRQKWLQELRHDIRHVLRSAGTPLSAPEIAKRLGRYVQLRTLRKELQRDPQCQITGHDAWTLEPESLLPTQSAHRYLDAAVGVLTRADRSMSTAELKEEAHLEIQTGYLKQKLDADPRFQRSAKDRWALAEWKLPVYKPIKELVSDLVDLHDGAADVDEVIRCLMRDFAIKESTLRQVMSSPPFTARGGTVRRLADSSADQHDAPAGEELDDDDVPTADDLIKGMGLI
ncbi:hypothetical protein ACFC18_31050 [Streptomyces sp. NPDC056121]|uniref:hypothetical protein n=1 Tax=Streptomyces sp. NPDC056121 TaxID=3345718 RepID=UPI0035E25470